MKYYKGRGGGYTGPWEDKVYCDGRCINHGGKNYYPLDDLKLTIVVFALLGLSSVFFCKALLNNKNANIVLCKK